MPEVAILSASYCHARAVDAGLAHAADVAAAAAVVDAGEQVYKGLARRVTLDTRVEGGAAKAHGAGGAGNAEVAIANPIHSHRVATSRAGVTAEATVVGVARVVDADVVATAEAGVARDVA
jgi:hypothetical protein